VTPGAGDAAPDGLEQRIAGIWREVLGTDAGGRDDDFFDVGGDSMLALRVEELAARDGLPIDVRDVFLAPTIRALVERVRDRAAGR
jgi:Phosphopantetheine attachment site